MTQTPIRPAPPLEDCPRCGADVTPGQEYCLDCGHRLPGSESGVVPRMAAAWQRRLPWYPGDWIWPVALGLVLAIAGAAFAILYSRAGTSSRSTIVATSPQGSVPSVTRPATDTGGIPPVVTPTVKIDTSQANLQPPGNAKTTTGATTPTTPPAKRGLTQWPAGRSGYTVVLESLPAGGGGVAAAERKAKQALAAGLPQVGVLESGKYSSLHPGYAVVFSGVYPTLAQAQTAAGAAQSKGFQSAYARQITT
ncbi:MAG TPA: zinc ribbon domain-containing protein [Gaiellaceae bacterium]|jgi:hypothetical protein